MLNRIKNTIKTGVICLIGLLIGASFVLVTVAPIVSFFISQVVTAK